MFAMQLLRDFCTLGTHISLRRLLRSRSSEQPCILIIVVHVKLIRFAVRLLGYSRQLLRVVARVVIYLLTYLFIMILFYRVVLGGYVMTQVKKGDSELSGIFWSVEIAQVLSSELALVFFSRIVMFLVP